MRQTADSVDESRLPVTVLGGYLGAGKTTLVNHLLRHAGGRRIAVLVNEFGALGIDGDLIESVDGEVTTIAGGCICCSYGDDLFGALVDLTKRVPPPEHLVIEASGVALPGQIAQAMTLLPGLACDAIVVMVDAETVRMRAADRYVGDTIDRQLRDADLVLVNKLDLVTAADTAAIRDWLATAYPGRVLVEAVQGRVDPAAVLGLDLSRQRPDAAGAPHAAGHLKTESFEITHAVDIDVLAQRLAAPALGIVRAKGFLRGHDGMLRTLQLVGARTALSEAPLGVSGPARLVTIAHGFGAGRAAIAAVIDGARVSPLRTASSCGPD